MRHQRKFTAGLLLGACLLFSGGCVDAIIAGVTGGLTNGVEAIIVSFVETQLDSDGYPWRR